jgi:acyl-CoA reductase LuxC
MTRDDRISGFAGLNDALINMDDAGKEALFARAANENPWFTPANIELALKGLSLFLDQKVISGWLDSYELPQTPRQVGLVMAGNIPLVGFHDFLCVLLAGHQAVIKLSSQDSVLMNAVITMLIKKEPRFSQQIAIVDKLPKVDAVIATGSDNSARYFKKYFQDIPHIIRKNRTSVAVLDGHEPATDLPRLGNDIFSFFGLGCRNVAKVFVPVGYDMKVLLDALSDQQEVINHHKYFNNYEYNKAIYLVNRIPHLDTGFALFTESTDLVSPLAVTYYETYTEIQHLPAKLKLISDKLQCIVSGVNLEMPTIPFGEAQSPRLNDYADNVDTLAFLCKI